MNKRGNKQHRIRYGQAFLWIGLAVLLALMSAGIALRSMHPIIPRVSVVSPLTYNEGGEVYIAGTDRHYAVVEIEVKNPTTKLFNLAPVLQTYLTDENGTRYEMAPVELENPIVAGVIQPGETRKGQLSFNVPKDVSVFYFHFVTDDAYQISYIQRL